MKRANFTLFQPQRWKSKLGQSALMVLFIWCCMGISNVNAQVTISDNGKTSHTSAKETLDPCNGEVNTESTQFTDDGKNDGNYADDTPRIDTLEFCPEDQWHRVQVVFNKFDLGNGDFLEVYDGGRKAVRAGLAPGTGSGATAGSTSGFVGPSGPVNGTGSGTGVSSAFGGWVDASCDPAVNPTGCLTFIFRTNGDKDKGAGWDAWVDCADRGINLKERPSVSSAKLTCTDNPYAPISIGHPGFEKDPPCTIDATVIATVRNQSGQVCTGFDKIELNTGGTKMGNFAIGIYTVEYHLKSDKEKKTTASFSVQAPSLVCNDDVIVPLGSACEIQLTPDDLLENPCEATGLGGLIRYNITVKLGLDTKNWLRTDTAGGVITYPVITKKAIAAAGMSVCGGTATVEIERIIYDTNLDGVVDLPTVPMGETLCHNGIQNASCETGIRFEDQSAPFISIATDADTLVACDTTGLARILNVKGIDNCTDDIKVEYTVDMSSTDPCDTSEITVHFTAVDDCGNVGKSSRTFILVRPTLDSIATYVEKARDCTSDDNGTRQPGLKIGTIKDGEFTVRDTVDLSTEEYICGYILTKRDVEIPATDCGRKIYRYWDVIDWCDPGTGPSPIDTAFIEYTDNDAPAFVGETETYTRDINKDLSPPVSKEREREFGAYAPRNADLGPFECTYNINFDETPVAEDDCDDNVNVRINRIFRVEDGADWLQPISIGAALDCDSFRIEYVASDQCHEQVTEDTTYQIVVVRDVTKPSAVCTDELNVSVPSDGGARIHWRDIDAGSVDACGITAIEIKREDDGDDAWAEYVDVVCEDVHNGVRIELRVTDKQGNINTCWMNVVAEDKIPPVCDTLPDMAFTCDEFHNEELGAATGGEFAPLTGDLLNHYNTTFGNPVCTDNLSCGILTITQEYKLTELSCGELEIERRWSAEDWRPNASNTGTQTIRVNYIPSWEIAFPADVDLTCGDNFPTAATAADIVTNGSCDLWALEVTDKVFEVPGDICMKIERTYELINWCVYEAGDEGITIAHNAAGEATVSSEGNEDVGRITYVQVLKLYVNEAPTITIDEVETCIVGEGDLAPFGEPDNTPGSAPFECDEERTFTASATNCAGVSLASANFTWKYYVSGALDSEGTGDSFTKVVSPKTKYKVEFWVSDGCGNSAGDDYEVEFWDCRKPTPYVLNGLAISINQTGSIQLWASDLDQGSYDNCTTKDKLDIRIGKGDPSQGPQDIDGVLALGKNLTFDCLELGTQGVSFYVIDEEQNWDVVGTYIVIQNNMGACSGDPVVDGSSAVRGKVTNALGENVEFVNVSVNSGDNSMTTGATGAYEFTLVNGGDYTITPEKNISPLNGVSTYDLVLISKHILGIQAFDSPYKYIAADVNKSGSITAFDMVQLRQLILNITSEFPNNSSWRFVDAKHEFSSENPAAENFNEFMSINNLDGTMANVDFIATKIGDVNGNAAANSLLGAESRTTNGALSLTATDRFVEAGQTVTVDFTSADIAATQGYQFTMNFAGLDLVELTDGAAKAANFNTNLAARGVITTSWNGEATADEVLFSLTFTANTNGLLSELVSVNSDITAAEAYNTAGELMDVSLNFNSSNVSAAFDLNQNTPNPFNGETVIGFNLPTAGVATLKVMDVQGKVLRVISQEGNKGYNQVTLNAKTLGATGVLYYQLESSDNIATKKMIIID